MFNHELVQKRNDVIVSGYGSNLSGVSENMYFHWMKYDRVQYCFNDGSFYYKVLK